MRTTLQSHFSSLSFPLCEVLYLTYICAQASALSIQIPESGNPGKTVSAKWETTSSSDPLFDLVLLLVAPDEREKLQTISDADFAKGKGGVEFVIPHPGIYKVVAQTREQPSKQLAESNLLRVNPIGPPPWVTASSVKSRSALPTYNSGTTSSIVTMVVSSSLISSIPTPTVQSSSVVPMASGTAVTAPEVVTTNHLNTKTIVGIVIGIVGGVVALSFVAFLLYKRRGVNLFHTVRRKIRTSREPLLPTLGVVVFPLGHPQSFPDDEKLAGDTPHPLKHSQPDNEDTEAPAYVGSHASQIAEPSSPRLLHLQQEASSPAGDTNVEELHAAISDLQLQVESLRNRLGDDGEPPPAYNTPPGLFVEEETSR